MYTHTNHKYTTINTPQQTHQQKHTRLNTPETHQQKHTRLQTHQQTHPSYIVYNQYRLNQCSKQDPHAPSYRDKLLHIYCRHSLGSKEFRDKFAH